MYPDYLRGQHTDRKLSDLLSYILYECNTQKCCWQKKLQGVEDLIFLSEAQDKISWS